MNKILAATSLVSMLIFGGCKTEETVTVDYIVPPKEISDVNSISTLEIIPNVKLSGSAIKNFTVEKQLVNVALTQSLSSRLCQNGYIKPVDSIWGNIDGVAQMDELISEKDSKHGYARIMTDSMEERATMNLNLTLTMNSNRVQDEIIKELVDTPYKIEYRDEKREYKSGDQKRTATVRVPYSSPDKSTSKKVSFKTIAYVVSGSGTLTAELVDKSGVKVYEKSFPNLSYSFRTSESVHGGVPTNTEVIAKMILPAIEEIAKDISPHKESRTLEINTDGSKKAVLLLRSLALTEAITALDELKDTKSSADYENLGVAYEAIGEYVSAESAFAKATELNPASEFAAQCKKRITSILEEKKQLRKNARKLDTQFKSSEYK
jgi:hypothetical protein